MNIERAFYAVVIIFVWFFGVYLGVEKGIEAYETRIVISGEHLIFDSVLYKKVKANDK